MSAMLAWAIGWQELVVIGGALGFIPFMAGLVMLIVGLSTKKRGLWIAGAIVMGVPLALALLMAVLMAAVMLA